MFQTLADTFTSLEQLVKLLTTAALGFAFPFVSEIRKEFVQVDAETRRFANIIAGIVTCALVLYLYSSRYSFYADFPYIRYWLIYLVIGIAFAFLHYWLVQRAKEGKSILGLGKRLTVVSYTLIFVFLFLGLNYKIFEYLFYYRYGNVSPSCETRDIQLARGAQPIGTIPLAWDDSYRAYFTGQELDRIVTMRAGNDEEDIGRAEDEVKIDFRCDS